LVSAFRNRGADWESAYLTGRNAETQGARVDDDTDAAHTQPAGNAGGAARTRATGNAAGAALTRPAGGDGDAAHAQPTIYDVARSAGVSIASVSRVLNDRRNPLPETKERVMQAVAELGFIPDGAARALSVRLKEVVGVVIRRPTVTPAAGDFYAEEEESLQFPDLINRGIEVAAQRRDFNLLVCSVDTGDYDYSRRIFALARKSDGLILHDQVLDPDQLARLSRQVPIVTLAGVQTATTTNVGGDNAAGMRELARHLVHDHGFRTLAYVSGHAGSPDDIARHAAFGAEVTASGASFADGPRWQGNYYAAGGARVIDRLLGEGAALPQAIACANDQTALGVVHALTRRGLDVPGDVAVTGFDDIPVARHLRPLLTTVRQPIQQLGATAFEAMYAMVCDGEPTGRNITLPTSLVRRESCGCAAGPAPATRLPAG
jgi:LacI family transcriptional regulator